MSPNVIVDRYSDGVSMLALAKANGVSSWKIRRVLEGAGVEIDPWRRNPPNKLSPAEVREAKKLYESGLTFAEAGRRMGRSEGVMRALKREHPEIIRPNSGPQSTRWRGGRTYSHGYAYVWIASDDPMAGMREKVSGRVLEHRLNLARKLGRPLLSWETVHHKDGNRLNNDPENLQLRHGRHGKHVALCCLDCGSKNIGPADLE